MLLGWREGYRGDEGRASTGRRVPCKYWQQGCFSSTGSRVLYKHWQQVLYKHWKQVLYKHRQQGCFTSAGISLNENRAQAMQAIARAAFNEHAHQVDA
jgi:hypothetical protein